MSSNTLEKPKTHVMDYSGIKLRSVSMAPEIVEVSEEDGFIINTSFTTDFRIRKEIYDMLKKAKSSLPQGYRMMIYEAYRPLKRQIELWDKVNAIFREKYPDASKEEMYSLCETYVSNPYNGIGSGHQAGCAVDVTLCDKDGNEVFMGTKCQEVHPHAATMSEGVSPEVRKNRDILFNCMENAGFLNYPEEWWHYSYGDYAWAVLARTGEALYGPMDI